MGLQYLKSPLTCLDGPNSKSANSRRNFGICLIVILVVIFMCYTQYDIKGSNEHHLNFSLFKIDDPKRYLIHTSKCRIPDDNPFNEDVRTFFHQENYVPCSKKQLLTYIEKTNNSAVLHINESVLQSYSVFQISCCYSAVSRVIKTDTFDDKISFSECIPFEKSAVINATVIMVKCKSSINVEVYSNVHAVISVQHVPRRKLAFSQDRHKNPISVVFVGIDSISKMNLVRTMPKTYKFLETHDFINLKGYTKIADNTFPNLMAILSGKTTDQVYEQCHPAKNDMNKCDIIWKDFNELGYISAYAEDETNIGTFNYGRKGFLKAPTDFYFRPYMIAAEQQPSIKRFGMHTCSGPENSGERIMNLAKDFLLTFKDYPKFGLFWMNSFSHDNLNLPSSMDEKIENFLKDIYQHLENTVFLFFSDHGFRFGDIRYTHTGWLEERLPFIYFYLPKSFKEEYVEEYSKFILNTKRLTNPFDIHMTLQDLLLFANANYSIKPSQACPQCHSLFKEVNEARSCKNAAIAQHWCMCTGHSYINPTRRIVTETANYVISKINSLVKSSKQGDNCATYYLKKVVSSGMSESYLNDENRWVNYFLLMFETRPPAMFEATVEVQQNYQNYDFRLLGDISRLNRYGSNSKCVKGSLEKYCYCDGLFTSIKSAICNFLNCL